MSEHLETKRCIKALYKYSSFPFFSFYTNKVCLMLNICSWFFIIRDIINTAKLTASGVDV